MKKQIIFILALSLHGFLMNAQEVKISKADKNYDKFAYVDAVKTYEKVAEKGHKSVEVFQKLGQDEIADEDHRKKQKEEDVAGKYHR